VCGRVGRVGVGTCGRGDVWAWGRVGVGTCGRGDVWGHVAWGVRRLMDDEPLAMWLRNLTETMVCSLRLPWERYAH
jgi:hypothetical protein